METRRLIAYILLALGTVTLLARISGGTGWLWVAVVAVGFLYAYAREGTYGLLVIGSILSGVAVGILLEGNLQWEGAFLVSLGAGIGAIDMIEPRASRWPRIVAVIVIVLGLGVGIAQAGVLGSTWFALVLIAAGIYLVVRRHDEGDDGWVHVGPPPDSEASYPQAPHPPEKLESPTADSERWTASEKEMQDDASEADEGAGRT